MLTAANLYLQRLYDRVAELRGGSDHGADERARLMGERLNLAQRVHIVADVLRGPLGAEAREALASCETLADVAVLLEARGTDLLAPAPADEPIAIIGLACRMPASPNPAGLWDHLLSGGDARVQVPGARWDIDAFYDPDSDTPGTLHTRHGHFLDRVDGFEPEFFQIAPREALAMDPQQRLMLELSWEALEDAGAALETLRGSRTAVCFGVMWNDYATLHGRLGFDRISPYCATGSHHAIVANRVSYALGLTGPSLAVDSSCSGALVAVHLACASLRAREATLALAGGVSLILAPDSQLMMAKFGGLAPDGRCKAFSAAADGYGRGEGGGVVVLKRLSAAIADGDRIYCVIRGSAVNNDGRSEGMTAPSEQAQRAVLADAYLAAGLDPAAVQYVEAHGTGTRLGDLVEARSLGAVLGRAAGRREPLPIGSVKTNIGHLESAAGVAGLIKVALSLHHQRLPASLHAERLNPNIDFDGLGLRVLTESSPWPRAELPRIAGINAFGFGGTNCHMIVSEAPAPAPASDAPPTGLPVPLLLSAGTEVGLRTRARALRAWLLAHPEVPLADVGWTHAARRWHHHHRLAVVTDARSQEHLLTVLDRAARGESDDDLLTSTERRARLAFVFPGQGAQWPGMGRDLLAADPGFRAGFERAAAAVAGASGLDLHAELMGEDDTRMEQTHVVQPLLFAMQLALAEMWRRRGVVADMLIGHSMGEIAAACVAGALSVQDGARIVCARSRLAADNGHGRGGMLLVGLDPEALAPHLAALAGSVEPAAFNDPHTTVLAGDLAPLRALGDRLEAAGVFCRFVRVAFASHCHHVDALREPLRAALAGLSPRAIPRERVEMLSTVTLRAVDGPELDSDYWVANMRRPVCLAAAVRQAMERGVGRFVEISPHTLLSASIEQTAASIGQTPLILPSMLRDREGQAVVRRTWAALHVDGQPVDWTRHVGQVVVGLPGYPWQRRRFWPDDLECAARGVATPVAAPSALIDASSSVDARALTPTDTAEEFIRAQLADLLLVDRRGLHRDRPLQEFGLDSLMAQRLRNAIERRHGVALTVAQLMREGTIATLAAWVGEARPAPGDLEPAPAPRPGASTESVEYATSAGQHALWFLHRLAPESAAYNIIFAGTARERLDPVSLTAALTRLVRRQSSLRVTFHAGEDAPRQRIDPEIALPFEVVDGREWDEARLAHEVSAAAHRPFDLERGPVFRVLLVRAAPAGDVLLFVVHHIVADGGSLDVLVDELQDYYQAARAGLDCPLDGLPARDFRDFVDDERAALDGPRGQRMRDYWREALAGELPRLSLPRTARPGDPVDRAPSPPRPAIQTFAGDELIARITPELARRVRVFASERGLTLFTVYLAAFSALLHRYTGVADIAVGSYVSRRDRAELERAVGYYLNTVVLRADFSDWPSFATLVERTRKRVHDALEHGALPFARVVEELKPRRDPAHSPLIDIVFNWLSPGQFGVLSSCFLGAEDGEEAAMPGVLGLRPYPLRRRFARFDLEIAMGETHGQTAIYLQYNTAVLDKTTVTSLAHHFEQLLGAMLDAPAREICSLSLLAPDEAQTILYRWNDTASNDERDPCIHERIAAQARLTPDQVALRVGEQALTYRELIRRADEISGALRGLGVGPGALVGVCTERSLHMLCGLIGILGAGAAYVPLDPAYPAERLALMIEDSGLRLVLTTSAMASVVPEHATALALDRPSTWAQPAARPAQETRRVTASDPAYVIYTSGSSGRPKGVIVTHGNVGALFHWADGAFKPEELSGTLASTSMCFDISVFELFYPLTMGGTVLLADNALVIGELPWADDITLINTVPSVMSSVIDLPRFPPSVRTVTLVGEPLRRDLVQRIYARPGISRVVNLYGPTEDTVFSTQGETCREDPNEPTIGRPIANTRCHVLDAALQPVPVLHVGELYLAGQGVARGYHARPELTAERFLAAPFVDDPGARMYKTGDLARYLPDGRLECLGRMDTQVKVSGYRIELGEIEAALTQLDEVRQAVVIVREIHGDRRLIGYYVPQAPSDDPATTQERIRTRLAQILPGYMVPAVFVAVGSFPMTPNGKIDRNELPAPIEHGRRPDSLPGHLEALSPTERKVAFAWAEVLALDPVAIGKHDGFYELGGHSLLLTALAPRLEALFARKIAVADLFRFSTLESLAGWLDADEAAGPDGSVTSAAKHRGERSRQAFLARRRTHRREPVT